jgi:hypothetical protein
MRRRIHIATTGILIRLAADMPVILIMGVRTGTPVVVLGKATTKQGVTLTSMLILISTLLMLTWWVWKMRGPNKDNADTTNQSERGGSSTTNMEKAQSRLECGC